MNLASHKNLILGVAAVLSFGLNTGVALATPTTGPIVFIADSQNNRIRAVNTATGIITTVAGNGTAGFSGDGGQATAAMLNHPSGLAVDSTTGNLYIADTQNNRIRLVTATTGVISTIAGNASFGFSGDGVAATSASLWNPVGLSLDASLNLYIADEYNNRIRKVNSGGVISTVFGNGTVGNTIGSTATTTQLYHPTGVAVISVTVYVADSGNQRVVFTNGISTSAVVGNGNVGYNCNNGTATSLGLHTPSGLAVNSSNTVLYLADYGNQCVRSLSGNINLATVAGNGVATFGGDGGQAIAASLNYPTGVALDSTGNLYIADFSNNRVRFVNTTTGVITTFAGNGIPGFKGDGGQATGAELYNPAAIAVYTPPPPDEC